MKKPARQDEAFLEDLARHAGEPGRLHLWWLGQSGFLVQWEGLRLLIDPYLSDSLTRKYADTDKPHVRMTERVVEPGRLEGIDLVTSSHNHTDHLDGETLLALRESNPEMTILVPAANRDFAAERLGLEPESLATIEADRSGTFAGITVHAVPAAHEELERDEEGRYRHLGHVFELGPWKIYHSGDTLLYEGQVERLRPHSVDLALLPVNGRAPERRVAGNLDGAEAARLAHLIGAGLVIPCHYDLFEFNTASPELFRRSCEQLAQPFVILENGEGWSAERA